MSKPPGRAKGPGSQAFAKFPAKSRLRRRLAAVSCQQEAQSHATDSIEAGCRRGRSRRAPTDGAGNHGDDAGRPTAPPADKFIKAWVLKAAQHGTGTADFPQPAGDP